MKNIFRLREFLEGFSISHKEALLIFEVYKSRRSHVGVDLISKKLSAHIEIDTDIEKMVKGLAHPDRGILGQYPAKKEVLCCYCTGLGVDIAQIIEENCYSEILPYYDEYDKKFSNLKDREYCNPAGWFPPRNFEIWNEDQEVLKIKILEMRPSNEVSHKTMGKLVYQTIANLEIECLKCKNPIQMEMKFKNNTFWGFIFNVTCQNCKETYEIMKDMRAFKRKA